MALVISWIVLPKRHKIRASSPASVTGTTRAGVDDPETWAIKWE